MSYSYIKQTDRQGFVSPKHKQNRHLGHKKQLISTGLLLFGISLLLSAVAPIVAFQLNYSNRLGQVVNPLSSKFYNSSSKILGEATTDYTQLNSWFVDTPQEKNYIAPNPGNRYSLSIPSLKIDDALVVVGSQDLKKNLIHYPQTALPGQLGNGVIFGHSVLPQFFNPKSYITIFATLYRLKTGDAIFVNYDGVKYKYLVEDMFEVKPTDLSILEQRYDNKYLTLVTCSPPGTYLRRLIVRTKITDY